MYTFVIRIIFFDFEDVENFIKTTGIYGRNADIVFVGFFDFLHVLLQIVIFVMVENVSS